MVLPWSARTTFPRATLTSMGSHRGPASADRQSGNGSASSGPHSMSMRSLARVGSSGIRDGRIVAIVHAGESDRVPVRGVGIRRVARARPADLDEDQDVALSKPLALASGRFSGARVLPGVLAGALIPRLRSWLRAPGIDQRGACRACRKAALPIAPRVERELVVVLVEPDDAITARKRHGLEHLIPTRLDSLQLLERQESGRYRASREPRDEEDLVGGEVEGAGSVERDGDPGPGIAPVVGVVVHEPRVAADRDTASSGVEIGFGRDGVLVVTEKISHVREQLDDGDADVRYVPLTPLWHQQRQPVQGELPEAGVVLREVADLDGWVDGDGTRFGGPAVVLAGARDGEAELDGRIVRIEARERAGRVTVLVDVHQAQRVGGEIARTIDQHFQAVVALGISTRAWLDMDHVNVANASAAFDPDVLAIDRASSLLVCRLLVIRQLVEQVHLERAAVLADLDVIDPVQARRGLTE
jgi:hypothetical protein